MAPLVLQVQQQGPLSRLPSGFPRYVTRSALLLLLLLLRLLLLESLTIRTRWAAPGCPLRLACHDR